MSQHHGGRQDHGSGVGSVAALNVQSDVSATRLEDGVLSSQGGSGHHTRTSDQTSTNVRQNGSVQVGGHQHIKLLGVRHGLHGSVVDNHVVDLNAGVRLTNLLDGGTEQTVRLLHNVGLVDGSHLLSVVEGSKVKGKSTNSLRVVRGDNLERLHNVVVRLVLQTRVLSLSVLSHQHHVDVVETGLHARDGLDKGHGSKNVQLLSQGNVERRVSGSLQRSVQNTLETDAVALERLQTLLVQLGVVSRRGALLGHSGHVNLLKVHRHVGVLEDCLDRLCNFVSNTISRNERNGVALSVLLGLEVGGLDRSSGSEGTGQARGGRR